MEKTLMISVSLFLVTIGILIFQTGSVKGDFISATIIGLGLAVLIYWFNLKKQPKSK